jgi:hypothetical protein
MGCMPPKCFSNVKNQDVENKCNIEGGKCPQAMCPHTLKKWSSHSQNHLGQNSFVKAHTPYPKGHWKKDVVNKSQGRDKSFPI